MGAVGSGRRRRLDRISRSLALGSRCRFGLVGRSGFALERRLRRRGFAVLRPRRLIGGRVRRLFTDRCGFVRRGVYRRCGRFIRGRCGLLGGGRGLVGWHGFGRRLGGCLFSRDRLLRRCCGLGRRLRLFGWFGLRSRLLHGRSGFFDGRRLGKSGFVRRRGLWGWFGFRLGRWCRVGFGRWRRLFDGWLGLGRRLGRWRLFCRRLRFRWRQLLRIGLGNLETGRYGSLCQCAPRACQRGRSGQRREAGETAGFFHDEHVEHFAFALTLRPLPSRTPQAVAHGFRRQEVRARARG